MKTETVEYFINKALQSPSKDEFVRDIYPMLALEAILCGNLRLLAWMFQNQLPTDPQNLQELLRKACTKAHRGVTPRRALKRSKPQRASSQEPILPRFLLFFLRALRKSSTPFWQARRGENGSPHRNSEGKNALDIAFEENWTLEQWRPIVQALKAHNQEPSSYNFEGRSLLERAAMCKNFPLATLLVEEGILPAVDHYTWHKNTYPSLSRAFCYATLNGWTSLARSIFILRVFPKTETFIDNHAVVERLQTLQQTAIQLNSTQTLQLLWSEEELGRLTASGPEEAPLTEKQLKELRDLFHSAWRRDDGTRDRCWPRFDSALEKVLTLNRLPFLEWMTQNIKEWTPVGSPIKSSLDKWSMEGFQKMLQWRGRQAAYAFRDQVVLTNSWEKIEALLPHLPRDKWPPLAKWSRIALIAAILNSSLPCSGGPEWKLKMQRPLQSGWAGSPRASWMLRP